MRVSTLAVLAKRAGMRSDASLARSSDLAAGAVGYPSFGEDECPPTDEPERCTTRVDSFGLEP